MFYGLIIKILDITTTGVPSILIALAFFNGITLFAIGILGIYVAQIYYEVKQRPKFIVKNIIEKTK